MNHSILFAYRPPVKPRPIRRGVFGDKITVKYPGYVDGFVFTDGLVYIPVQIHAVDTLALSDTNSITPVIFNLVDTVMDGDGVNVPGVSLTDGFIFNDVAVINAQVQNLVDTLTLTDTAAAQLLIVLSDALQMSDAVIVPGIIMGDSFSMTDNLNVSDPQKISIDSLPVIDQAIYIPTIFHAVDTITESDTSALTIGKNIEGFWINDYAAWKAIIYGDTISYSDSVAGIGKYSNIELVTPSDTLTNVSTH